jgi:hypothetical protein
VHYRAVDPDDPKFGEFSQREALRHGRVTRGPEVFRVGDLVAIGGTEIRDVALRIKAAAERYAAEHGIRAGA